MSNLSMSGTLSKHPKMWGFPDNFNVVSGFGVDLLINDGNTYLDWVCGLGSNLLGYSQPPGFVNALMNAAKSGIGFSIQSEMEEKVAEKLINVVGIKIPGFDKDSILVRFAKTGTDATAMAVRLARAVTGKEHILHCGYSGWASEFVAETPPALGVPKSYGETISTFEFNNPESFMKQIEDHKDDLAAIIIEQGIYDPEHNWYELLRQVCDDNGAIFILDEIVTGLRYSIGGAAERYNIHPDLVTMGKALGNGLPISALVGRKEYLEWFAKESPVFCSSTHWGETMGLSAADFVLDYFTYEDVDLIWRNGQNLIQGLNDAGWKTIGHAPRSILMFDDDLEKAFFIHGMRNERILMNRPNFVSLAHTDKHVIRTVDAAKKVRETYEAMDKKAMKKEYAKKMPVVLFRSR